MERILVHVKSLQTDKPISRQRDVEKNPKEKIKFEIDAICTHIQQTPYLLEQKAHYPGAIKEALYVDQWAPRVSEHHSNCDASFLSALPALFYSWKHAEHSIFKCSHWPNV